MIYSLGSHNFSINMITKDEVLRQGERGRKIFVHVTYRLLAKVLGGGIEDESTDMWQVACGNTSL